MTRDQMRDLIVQHTRREDKLPLIEQAIALAVAELGQLHEWRELRYQFDITLAMGERYVNIESGVFHVLSLRLIDADQKFYPVELWSKTHVVQKYPDEGNSSTGRPLVAYEDTGQLWLAPKADKQYIVRVDTFRLHPELKPSEQPLVQAVDNAIVAWATAYVFRSIQMYEDANQWMQEYARAMGLALKAERRTHFKRVLRPVNEQIPMPRIEPWLDPFAKR